MCKYETGRQKFNLVYRGSRDGFRASDFHSKCDNRPNTLTIIQTTKGFVFGGYTSLSWYQTGQSYYDSDAFLFSLINKFKKPFLCKSLYGSHAICCNLLYGPTFGNFDIQICDNSNACSNSYARINSGNYQPPSGLNDLNGNYFCDGKNFQVKDIEVFQIEL